MVIFLLHANDFSMKCNCEMNSEQYLITLLVNPNLVLLHVYQSIYGRQCTRKNTGCSSIINLGKKYCSNVLEWIIKTYRIDISRFPIYLVLRFMKLMCYMTSFCLKNEGLVYVPFKHYSSWNCVQIFQSFTILNSTIEIPLQRLIVLQCIEKG